MESKFPNTMTFLERSFLGKTVDVQRLQTAFFNNPPSYLKNGLAAGVEGKTLINLSLTSKLETRLREYVCGKVDTMGLLLDEAVRLEKSTPLVAPTLIKIAFVNVGRIINQYEFYELMARYREAEASCMCYLKLVSCN